MTFDEVKELLQHTTRHELRDHAFGDKEVYFVTATGEQVAEGYWGSSGASVGVGGTVFEGEEAEQLLKLGALGNVARNDSQG